MLKALVNDASMCNLLLIQDSVKQRDDSLMYACLKARCKLADHTVDVFLFEHSVEEVRTALNVTTNHPRLQFHDFYVKANAWIVSQELPDVPTREEMLHGLVDLSSGKRVVVTDSLLAFGRESSKVGYCLSALKNHANVTQLIVLAHDELLPDDLKKTLRYLAQASVRQVDSFRARHVNDLRIEDVCEVEFKKPTGKLLIQKERYVIKGVHFEVDSKPWTPEVDGSGEPMVNNHSDAATDHDVTFKLDLTEREQAQKSQLILPYTQGSGKIVYEADEADDFDDEDPDEDLEI